MCRLLHKFSALDTLVLVIVKEGVAQAQSDFDATMGTQPPKIAVAQTEPVSHPFVAMLFQSLIEAERQLDPSHIVLRDEALKSKGVSSERFL